MIIELKLEPAGYTPGREGTVYWNHETGELAAKWAEKIIAFIDEHRKSGEPIIAYNMGLEASAYPLHDHVATATVLAELGYKIPAELEPFLPSEPTPSEQGNVDLAKGDE